MKNNKPLTITSIKSQLQIMEHFAHDILCNIESALNHLDKNELNAAVGSLLCSPEAIEHLQTLHKAVILMYESSHIIERDED